MKTSRDQTIGLRGVYAVMLKLAEFGIDFLPTPFEWHFDLMTEFGDRLEVKFANKTNGKGGRGNIYETYACLIKEHELRVADFFILVMNTDKGNCFYIIPAKYVTSRQIAFNPHSSQRSKYERFRDRWDFLIRNPKSIGILKYLNGHK